MIQSLKNKEGETPLNPYCDTIPRITRPKDNLSRPETQDEKLYCWFYWIEAILEPSLTRKVLDNLEYQPEFRVPWGSDWSKGEELYLKTH